MSQKEISKARKFHEIKWMRFFQLCHPIVQGQQPISTTCPWDPKTRKVPDIMGQDKLLF